MGTALNVTSQQIKHLLINTKSYRANASLKGFYSGSSFGVEIKKMMSAKQTMYGLLLFHQTSLWAHIVRTVEPLRRSIQYGAHLLSNDFMS